MESYCLLDKARKNVLEGPKRLSVNWKNISNLPALSDEQLNNVNWVPAVYPELIFNSATQKRLADTLTIKGNQVDVTFNIEDKTQEELDANAAAIAEQALASEYRQKIEAEKERLAIESLIGKGELPADYK